MAIPRADANGLRVDEMRGLRDRSRGDHQMMCYEGATPDRDPPSIGLTIPLDGLRAHAEDERNARQVEMSLQRLCNLLATAAQDTWDPAIEVRTHELKTANARSSFKEQRLQSQLVCPECACSAGGPTANHDHIFNSVHS